MLYIRITYVFMYSCYVLHMHIYIYLYMYSIIYVYITHVCIYLYIYTHIHTYILICIKAASCLLYVFEMSTSVCQLCLQGYIEVDLILRKERIDNF